MKRIVLVLMVISFACGVVRAKGQHQPFDPAVTSVKPEPYDPSRETTFQGKILRVDPPPCNELPYYSYHIHVQLPNEIVEVHLGPCTYAKDRQFPLNVGDQIQGTGSVANWTSGPRRVIIAREIHRGKQVMQFRDATGKALWK